MKHQFLTFATCALLLLAAGCKPKEEPVNPDKQSFSANVERPTWTATANHDMTSSMTAVVKVDLATQYPDIAKDFVLNDNDLIAAFSDETCLSVAAPDEGLFYLYIGAPVTGNPSSITLRYYSAYYKNLFEAKDAFPYVSDSRQGNADTPFIPTFVVVK